MKDIANQLNQERAQAEQGEDRARAAWWNAGGAQATRARIDAPLDAKGKRFCYRFAMLRNHRLENSGNAPLRGGV